MPNPAQAAATPIILQVRAVKPPIPDLLWWRALDLLNPAIEAGTQRLDSGDYLARINDNRMQLWVGWDAIKPGNLQAAMVTEVIQYPRVRAVRIELLGAKTGTVQSYLDTAFNRVCDWARSEGCSIMEIAGRDGWQKKLADYGFEKTHVHMERKL